MTNLCRYKSKDELRWSDQRGPLEKKKLYNEIGLIIKRKNKGWYVVFFPSLMKKFSVRSSEVHFFEEQ